jgi:hypothetical protein
MPDMLIIRMEDVFKVRVQESKAYKVIDKSRDDNGISVDFEGPGGNDDMNYFLETEGVSDSARNYKVTYLLNQNHSSYSDEQWWVPLDGRGQIQCCVTGHFTDGTWMRYRAVV